MFTSKLLGLDFLSAADRDLQEQRDYGQHNNADVVVTFQWPLGLSGNYVHELTNAIFTNTRSLEPEKVMSIETDEEQEASVVGLKFRTFASDQMQELATYLHTPAFGLLAEKLNISMVTLQNQRGFSYDLRPNQPHEIPEKVN